MDCSRLVGLIDRHCRAPEQRTPLAGLSLYRAEAPQADIRSRYRSVVCIVAQGRKRVVFGGQVFDYDAARYLVATVEVPVVGHVTEASTESPYLCVALELDPRLLAQVLMETPPELREPEVAASLGIGRLNDHLVDAMTRLVGLLDAPLDAAVLAPLIQREILYRLLQGDQGALLRQAASSGSRLGQIARATDWILENFDKSMSVEALAARVGMSVTAFHRHFRAVTGATPLQYRTQARLQEARRLLLLEGQNAGAVGLRVGYDSPSQFSREYKALFGLPPAADAQRLRASLH